MASCTRRRGDVDEGNGAFGFCGADGADEDSFRGEGLYNDDDDGFVEICNCGLVGNKSKDDDGDDDDDDGDDSREDKPLYDLGVQQHSRDIAATPAGNSYPRGNNNALFDADDEEEDSDAEEEEEEFMADDDETTSIGVE